MSRSTPRFPQLGKRSRSAVATLALLAAPMLLPACHADGAGDDGEHADGGAGMTSPPPEHPEYHSWVKVSSEPRRFQARASESGVEAALDSVRIGRGFDSAKEEWLGNCAEDVGLGTLGGGDSTQVQYAAEVVKDWEELTTKYGAGIKVSLGLGDMLSAGAEFRLAQEAKLNQYSTQVVARVHVEQQTQSLNRYRLRDWVVESLRNDPTFVTSGKFAEKCGNGFASGFKTGGDLIVLMVRNNGSVDEKLTIDAALNVKVGALFNGDATARAELMKVLGTDKTKIYVFSQGAVTLLPNLDNFLERASAFPRDVKEAGGWPIEVRVTPYNLVENWPNIDSPANQRTRRVLEEMASYRKAVLPIHSDNVYIDTHRGEFYDLDDAAHRESLVASRDLLKLIEDAAAKCYEQNVCEVPQLPQLPRRPAATRTPASTEYRALRQISGDVCPVENAQERCDVPGVVDVCKPGLRTCQRRGDGVRDWGSCVPIERNGACEDGIEKSCVTGPYDCPGTQKFSRLTGWSACMPRIFCECRPGTTKAADPGACDNGAPAPAGQHTCGIDYRWSGKQCTSRPEVCGNGLDDDLNGSVDDRSSCHQFTLRFENVDDNYFVWLNSTEGDNVGRAICHGRGAGSCDLSSEVARRGNPDSATIIVKFGNGNCLGSHGRVMLDIDGTEVHNYNISSGPVHCGFFYRWKADMDFRHGGFSTAAERRCDLPTDCMY